jgi:hypothetical protein
LIWACDAGFSPAAPCGLKAGITGFQPIEGTYHTRKLRNRQKNCKEMIIAFSYPGETCIRVW